VARTLHGRLARTINIGLALGAPTEQGWTMDLTERQLEACATAGFSAVRIAVSCAAHVRKTGSTFSFDPAALETIARGVERATGLGLAVVVANTHDPDLMADPPAHRERVLSCTQRLASALAHYGPSVALEPLAEPQQRLDATWNALVGELLRSARDVDGRRTLIVGPAAYNNARFLPMLELPEDERNLIVTIHQYWPIRFTMQGETWLGQTPFGDPADWLGTRWSGATDERHELTVGFDGVEDWARASNRPVFVGEFGTSANADMPSRVRWTSVNRELAEQRGFSWGCWSFGPSFAVYDLLHDRWHDDLLQALIPR
jgi:endoglucanase